MRQAFNGAQVYFNEDGTTPLAINLGYDFCAEHEWGIKGLNEKLGRWTGSSSSENKVWGLDRHKVTTGSNVYMHKIKKFYFLTTEENIEQIITRYVPYAEPKEAEGIVSYWDSDDFCVAFTNKKTCEFFLKKFHENKISIGVGTTTNPFGRGGIALTTDDYYNTVNWYDVIVDQKAHLAMWDKHRSTHIEKKLTKAGKRWFALSPKMTESGDIQYWLNPMDQHINNSCWCSLNDLELWIGNKGPIPKRKD